MTKVGCLNSWTGVTNMCPHLLVSGLRMISLRIPVFCFWLIAMTVTIIWIVWKTLWQIIFQRALTSNLHSNEKNEASHERHTLRDSRTRDALLCHTKCGGSGKSNLCLGMAGHYAMVPYQPFWGVMTEMPWPCLLCQGGRWGAMAGYYGCFFWLGAMSWHHAWVMNELTSRFF